MCLDLKYVGLFGVIDLVMGVGGWLIGVVY